MTEVTSELRIWPRHIRAAKICMGGSRQFFSKHDLNWNDFLANGIPVTVIEGIGDPIALRAAAEAVKEGGDHGRL